MEISAKLTQRGHYIVGARDFVFFHFQIFCLSAVTLISRLQFLAFDIDQLKQLTTTHRIIGKN